MPTLNRIDIASKTPGYVVQEYVVAMTTTTVAASTFTAALTFDKAFKDTPTVLSTRISSGTYSRKSTCFSDTVTTTGLTVGVVGTATADLPDSSSLVTVSVIVHGRTI